MKIGNIISEEEILVGEEFNVVSSLDDIIEGIPTLYVGLDLVKSDEDLDFLERQLGEHTFWTFTDKEHRNYHIGDLARFINYCYTHLISDIHYIFIDPIQFNKSKMKKVLNKIKSLENSISYVHGEDMIYIYGDNLIFGVDLKLLRFMRMDVDKILSRIKSLSTVFLDNREVFIEYKNYLERLDNQPKYIPFLYSVFKNE